MAFRSLLLAVCLLCSLFSHAQITTGNTGSIAYEHSGMHQSNITYSPAVFTYSIRNHRHSRKWVAGGIVALSGAVLTYGGILAFALGSDQTTGPPNDGLRNTGLAIMSAGGIAAIVGGVLAHQGLKEQRGWYGWHIVAPTPNELGIAYTIK